MARRSRFFNKNSVFSHEKAQLALNCLEELMSAIPAEKRADFVGQREAIASFIEEAQTIAPFEIDPLANPLTK